MENVVTHENDVTVFDRRETKERLLFNFQGPSGQVGHINAEGPPVPIPNTEVKLCSAESTTLATAWEGRSWPTPQCKGAREILLLYTAETYGGVAQLGEHLPCKQGVMGSNPIISTIGENEMNEIHRKLTWAHSSGG